MKRKFFSFSSSDFISQNSNFILVCSSGNCQIIHWRQVHKHECQILETHKLNSSPLAVSVDEFSHMGGLCYENMKSQFCEQNLVSTLNESSLLDNLDYSPIGITSPAMDNCAFFNNSHVSTIERKTSHKPNRETRRRNSETTFDSYISSSGHKATNAPSVVAAKELFVRQKVCLFNFDIPSIKHFLMIISYTSNYHAKSLL